MFNSDVFANRPTAGITGRVFISTDTYEFYRDNGTTWDLIGGPGSSTITGSGTATQVAFFSSGSAISSDSSLYWDNTNKRLGIGNSTPGAPLDVHGTGTNAQFNGTGTNNAQVFLQNAGVSKWSIGNIYSTGSNYFRIYDVLNSTERYSIQNSGSMAWTGYGALTDTRTYSTGTIESFNAAKNLTIPNGATMSAGGTIASLLGSGNINLNGLITIPNSKTFATELLTGQISFNAAGSGLTMTQASGGIRAATNEYSIAYFGGGYSGSIDYYAQKVIGGYANQNSGSITPTITNAYQLLINDINEYSHTFSFTNRWGIYQNGSSDNNYFAAKVLIGSNVVSIYQLDVTGLARITGNALISSLTIGQGTNSVAFNSALGIQVLQANTTGNWCTGVGYQALQNNTSGNFNTGIGSNVLSAVGSNSHNTAAGFGTFQYLTSGSNNIAIGSQAGQKISGGSTNLTTSNNSIFIGYSAYPLADSQTNQIVIGNAAVGLGSNTTLIGNSSTITSAIYGNLLLGSTTDSGSAQKLQVTGQVLFQGSVTGVGNLSNYTINASSGAARSKYISSTLVATANNDNLVALDIFPTFTNGAFTGVNNFAIRTNSKIYSTNATSGFSTTNAALGIEGGIYCAGYSQIANELAINNNSGRSNGSFASASATSLTMSNAAVTTLRTFFVNGPIHTATNASLVLMGGIDLASTLMSIGSGSSVTNTFGIRLQTQTIGTNNVHLLFGTSLPTGNWSIYNPSSYSNYLEGSIGIGTSTIDASAKLQISSTTKGFLPPAMTTTQKNAISTPAAGLIVFDTTLAKLCVYSGSAWQTITSV